METEEKRKLTLLELILIVLVGGIMALVASRVILAGFDTYSMVVNKRHALQQAEVAMSRMVQEMVRVKSSDIWRMWSSQFGFFDADNNQVRFRPAWQSNVYCVFREGTPLAENIGRLSFQYYTANGDVALLPTELKKIHINLSVHTLGGYGDIDLRTNVFPRNYMYNDMFH